jgi:fluoride exporter
VSRFPLVGAGGFVGSVLRYGLGTWVQSAVAPSLYPFGTTLVNLAGCLAIGLLAGLAETRELLSVEARLLLLVGVLGGFTTFSTFGLETVHLLRAGHGGLAVANVGIQVFFGVGAVWAGLALARSF